MRGYYRIHYALSEVIQLLHAQKVTQAHGYIIQILKSLRQIAIDDGSWQNALHLLPTVNPIDRREFGGTHSELRQVFAYKKSLAQLRNGGHQNQWNQWWQWTDGPGKGQGKNDKGKGKGAGKGKGL